ncbi:MAG TPA: hypothetical protein VKE51_36420 [Vicinamibacterales bacterium]|nr:hypothetical protein [Vicinamibacterales bacterium]
MRKILALLLAFPFAPSAQAAPLTLGCAGSLTTTTVPRDGVAADPIEDIVDISVIVDFDKRAVSGFWFDLNGHDLIQITAADANAVTFNRVRRYGSLEQSIRGTVDRSTGKIDAREALFWRSGNLSHVTWDLSCTPAS